MVKNAKRTPWFFFKQEGRCKDGNNCYFSQHSNKPRRPLEGSIKNWVENGISSYGFIKSAHSDDNWFFKENDLEKDFPQKIKIGMKVKVGNLRKESGKSMSATGISLNM